jgi:hypothetical protein
MEAHLHNLLSREIRLLIQVRRAALRGPGEPEGVGLEEEEREAGPTHSALEVVGS